MANVGDTVIFKHHVCTIAEKREKDISTTRIIGNCTPYLNDH